MIRGIIITLSITLFLSGCVKQPTRNTQMVDDRPGLTFDLAQAGYQDYELKIDGISYGRVGQYQEGERYLRIIDGMHTIQLFKGDRATFQQEVYLGAGSIKVIEVTIDE